MTLTSTGAAVTLKGLVKRYGSALVVDQIDLHIKQGEFFSLLGPSGCGKTTTLRMVAGFESADAGSVCIGDDEITSLPPHRRGLGMVFQSYALFPHRTVADNVAFGLRMRSVPADEIHTRVTEALAMVRLSDFKDRRPGQLSGGQQQRVALARALVIRPKVLLCDEPLGALDRKLRQALQAELKELQRRTGVTLIFVTHDQEEALAMSDRIGVMNKGRLEQVAAPEDIYNSPASRFVAQFIGEVNLFEGMAADGLLTLADSRRVPAPQNAQGPVSLALRPEHLTLTSVDEAALRGVVQDSSFLGDRTQHRVAVEGLEHSVIVQVPGNARALAGSVVGLSWDSRSAVVLQA